jgi:hypothetical protein
MKGRVIVSSVVIKAGVKVTSRNWQSCMQTLCKVPKFRASHEEGDRVHTAVT